jgi:hypothetical protein
LAKNNLKITVALVYKNFQPISSEKFLKRAYLLFWDRFPVEKSLSRLSRFVMGLGIKARPTDKRLLKNLKKRNDKTEGPGKKTKPKLLKSVELVGVLLGEVGLSRRGL